MYGVTAIRFNFIWIDIWIFEWDRFIGRSITLNHCRAFARTARTLSISSSIIRLLWPILCIKSIGFSLVEIIGISIYNIKEIRTVLNVLRFMHLNNNNRLICFLPKKEPTEATWVSLSTAATTSHPSIQPNSRSKSVTFCTTWEGITRLNWIRMFAYNSIQFTWIFHIWILSHYYDITNLLNAKGAGNGFLRNTPKHTFSKVKMRADVYTNWNTWWMSFTVGRSSQLNRHRLSVIEYERNRLSPVGI